MHLIAALVLRSNKVGIYIKETTRLYCNPTDWLEVKPYKNVQNNKVTRWVPVVQIYLIPKKSKKKNIDIPANTSVYLEDNFQVRRQIFIEVIFRSFRTMN